MNNKTFTLYRIFPLCYFSNKQMKYEAVHRFAYPSKAGLGLPRPNYGELFFVSIPF